MKAPVSILPSCSVVSKSCQWELAVKSNHGLADSKEAALDPQVPSGLIPKRNSTRHIGMNSQELSWFARSERTLPQDQRFLRERTVPSVPLGSQVCSTFGGQLFTKPGHWSILPRHASLGTPGWRRPAPSRRSCGAQRS